MALALKTKTKTRLDTEDLDGGDLVAIVDTDLELEDLADYMANSQLALNNADEIVLDIDQSAMPEKSDKIVGKLSTEFSKGHVASLLRCGMLVLTDYDDLPASAKKKAPNPKRKRGTTTQPPAPTTDPTDEDLDDDSEEDEPSDSNVVDEATRPSAPSTESAKTEEIAIDPSLDGLPLRIQKVLTVRGLATKAAIQFYIAGGKELDDVEDIGPKAAAQIESWLA
jgi:hypothetical protein